MRIAFLVDGQEICVYSEIAQIDQEEIEATKGLLAYNKGIRPEGIEVVKQY